MRREAKKRRNIIIALTLVLCLMTAGYAAYQTQLNIGSTANINTKWDIEITNVEVAKDENNKDKITGKAENVTATYDNTNGLTATMEANLYKKGDSVEYEVTIKNKGDLDARLNSIEYDNSKVNDAVKITFSNYTKGERLAVNESKIIKVKIEYNPNFNGTVNETISSEVKATFNYTQGNGKGAIAPQDIILLTYDYTTNGGTSSDAEDEYVGENDEIDLTKAVATKKGFEFVGWNTNKDAETAINTITMDENKTVYAIFRKTINITYTKDENTNSIGKENDVCNIYNNNTTCEKELPIITPNTDYEADGWYLEDTKVGNPGGTYAFTSDTTLQAKSKTSLKQPTFSQTNNIVTITFPSGCTSPIECKYTIDEVEHTVTESTVKVYLSKTSNIVAEATLEETTESITYTGTYTKLDPLMQSWTSSSTTDFHNSTYKSKITSVEVQDTINIPDDAVEVWDVSSSKNGSVLAYIINDIEAGKYKLYICGDGKVKANSNSSYVFYNFAGLKTVNLSKLDTSNATNMSGMFGFCNDLTSLDVSNFDTSKVTDMSGMFSGCRGLTSLDVSNFDTSKVTNMNSMFSYCNKITSLDVSNFDTSKVTHMEYMFIYCINLTSLDVSNFDTGKVTDMTSMFESCRSLTSLDVSNFDTSNVTKMGNDRGYGMFFDCSKLSSLDLSNFDTSKVTDMSYMFDGCTNLETIYASEMFVTDKVTSSSFMFTDSTKLVGGNGTTYNASYIDKTRALIDKEGQVGYFTDGVTPKISNVSTNTTNTTITTVVSATVAGTTKKITNYEFSIDDGTTWQTSTTNTYTFTGLNESTTYTIKVKVNSQKSASETVTATTKGIQVPNFIDDGGEVTINYHNLCSETGYECYYKKIEDSDYTAAIDNQKVPFATDGTLIAKIIDNVNEVVSTYNVVKTKLYVKSNGNDEAGYGTVSAPYATLTKAYSSATSTSTPSTIYVMDDINPTTTTTMDSNKAITLTSSNTSGIASSSTINTIKKTSALNDYMVRVTNGSLALTNITLDGNNISDTEGAIFLTNNVTSNLNTGSTIKNFNSSDHGAGVRMGASTLNLNGGEISNNTATYYGGGIFLWNTATLNINSGTIKNNKATENDGGGIRSNGTVNIKGGTISDNSAKNWGGAIMSYGTLLMSDGTISNNSAGWGGGMFVQGKTTLTGGKMDSNTANSGNGGGIYVSDNTADNVTIDGVTISNNKTTNGYGGGVHNGYNSTLLIKSGKIDSNNSSKEAGGIMNYGTITMTGGTISNNTASWGGGGLHQNVVSGQTAPTFTFSGGTMNGNKAQYGGGIFNGNYQSVGTSGTVNLEGGTISNNTATSSSDGGGGIYSWSTVNVKSGTISSNTAAGDGGGIFSNGTLNMSNGTISNNTSSKSGGGIFSTGNTTVSGGSITSNKSSDVGAAIFSGNDTSKVLTITGGSITGNTSPKCGSGIATYNSKMVVSGGTINNNSAATDGTRARDDVCIGGSTIISQNNVSSFTANKEYYVANKLSGKVLNVAGVDTTANRMVKLYSYNGTGGQKWNFIPSKIINGIVYYVPESSISYMHYLNMSGYYANYGSGDTVEVYTLVPEEEDFYWYLEKSTDGYLYIKNKWQNLCMEAAGGGTENGTNVQVYTCNQTDAQKWSIVQVS